MERAVKSFERAVRTRFPLITDQRGVPLVAQAISCIKKQRQTIVLIVLKNILPLLLSSNMALAPCCLSLSSGEWNVFKKMIDDLMIIYLVFCAS